MKKNKIKLSSFRHLYFFLILIITGLFMIQCGGLVRLTIPEDSYQDAWITPFGSNQRQNSVNRDVLPPYKILWVRGFKSVITDQPLAINNYLIFTIKNGTLGIINIERGDVTGDGQVAPGFNHAPVLHENIIYYAANLGDETLGGLNLINLKHTLKKKLPHLTTSPLVWGDQLYVGTDDGKFISIDRESGSKIWEFSTKAPIMGNPANKGNRIYFSDVKGNFFCVDAENGYEIWTTKLESNIYTGPVIHNENLFIGSTSGVFYSLNAETGKILWSLKSEGSFYGNAAAKEGTIYVGNNSHKLYAINAKNGEINWEHKTKGIINSAPLVGPNYVYFGSWDKAFYVLDRRNGDLVYRKEFDKAIKTSPLIFQNRIFVQTANEEIYCLANEKMPQKKGP